MYYDEKYFKVLGEDCYDLNAIDSKTKYILAHSSVEERTKEECYKFLEQIKDSCYEQMLEIYKKEKQKMLEQTEKVEEEKKIERIYL